MQKLIKLIEDNHLGWYKEDPSFKSLTTYRAGGNAKLLVFPKDVECLKTITLDDKIEDVENSNFTIEADTIIFAIGLKIEEEFLNSIGIETENGLVKIDENQMTSVKNVFAGGDLTEKNQTVCQALASGKRAAKAIEKLF